MDPAARASSLLASAASMVQVGARRFLTAQRILLSPLLDPVLLVAPGRAPTAGAALTSENADDTPSDENVQLLDLPPELLALIAAHIQPHVRPDGLHSLLTVCKATSTVAAAEVRCAGLAASTHVRSTLARLFARRSDCNVGVDVARVLLAEVRRDQRRDRRRGSDAAWGADATEAQLQRALRALAIDRHARADFAHDLALCPIIGGDDVDDLVLMYDADGVAMCVCRARVWASGLGRESDHSRHSPPVMWWDVDPVRVLSWAVHWTLWQ